MNRTKFIIGMLVSLFMISGCSIKTPKADFKATENSLFVECYGTSDKIEDIQATFDKAKGKYEGKKIEISGRVGSVSSLKQGDKQFRLLEIAKDSSETQNFKAKTDQKICKRLAVGLVADEKVNKVVPGDTVVVLADKIKFSRAEENATEKNEKNEVVQITKEINFNVTSYDAKLLDHKKDERKTLKYTADDFILEVVGDNPKMAPEKARKAFESFKAQEIELTGKVGFVLSDFNDVVSVNFKSRSNSTMLASVSVDTKNSFAADTLKKDDLIKMKGKVAGFQRVYYPGTEVHLYKAILVDGEFVK